MTTPNETMAPSETPCAACGAGEFRPRPNKTSLPLRQCRECGHVMQWPQPTDEALNALYTRDYFRGWGLDGCEDEMKRMKLATFRRLIQRSGLRAPARVLDVGCATGHFLDAARDEGLTPYGVEVSEWAAAGVRERFGAERVHHGMLETAPWADSFFDGIFMSDLIEHVREPRETLGRAWELLRPGGTLVCVTPQVNSLSYWLMGGSWQHFHMEHLNYFTPESLRRLLGDIGFESIVAHTNRKAIMPAYALHQLHRTPHPLVTPLVGGLLALLKPWRYSLVWLPLGDMVCMAKKPGSSPKLTAD